MKDSNLCTMVAQDTKYEVHELCFGKAKALCLQRRLAPLTSHYT